MTGEAVTNVALNVWSNTCNAYCNEEDLVHAEECRLASGLYHDLARPVTGEANGLREKVERTLAEALHAAETTGGWWEHAECEEFARLATPALLPLFERVQAEAVEAERARRREAQKTRTKPGNPLTPHEHHYCVLSPEGTAHEIGVCVRCGWPNPESLDALVAEAWDQGRESIALDFTRPADPSTGLRQSTPNPYRSDRDT